MEKYNIVEFKRVGFVSFIIGSLLKVFEHKWDGWGWHLAVAWERVFDGWILLEAVAKGVSLNFHSDKELSANTRSYHWFDKPLTFIDEDAVAFYYRHIEKKYDVAVYLWTALQYFARHLLNHRVPRLLDDRFTCWELVSEFCDEMGKPVESKYDCPMLPDILKQLQK